MRVFCVEAHSFVSYLSIDLRDNFTMSSQRWLIFELIENGDKDEKDKCNNNNRNSTFSPFSFHSIEYIFDLNSTELLL